MCSVGTAPISTASWTPNIFRNTMLFRAAEQSIDSDQPFHIPDLPDASMKYRGEKIHFNAAEYDRLCEVSGKYLLATAGSISWNIGHPSEIDLKRFRRILSVSRIRARRDILREQR